MSRPATPDLTYADAVKNSPAPEMRPLPTSPLSSPTAPPAEERKIEASSPDIPLSSLPLISTQDQILMEKSADIQELETTEQGWQLVTPKKNRKKNKKALHKIQDSNKCPYTNSPLKERETKRRATDPREAKRTSTDSAVANTPCPSPTPSYSTLEYTDDDIFPGIPKTEYSPFLKRTPDMEEGQANLRPMTQTPQTAQTNDLGSPTPKNSTPHPRKKEMTQPPNQPTRPKSLPVTSPTPSQAKEERKPPTGMIEREGTPMSISTHQQMDEGTAHSETKDDNPELWFETTEANVTTNGKGLRRTATLLEGWPKVYLAASPSYNITKRTLEEWEVLEGPTLWARLYRAKYEPTENGKTKMEDAIKDIIKKLVCIKHDEETAVIFPDQALPADASNRFPHPYHLLVVGLSHTQVKRLTDLEVVATKEATVFFIPRIPPRHTYIMTLRGLKYNNTVNAKALVEDLVQTTFRLSPEIRAITDKKTNEQTADNLDQALNIRASFLPVKQRNATMRCWNIYFQEDPGLNEEEHKLLVRKMRACSFKTISFGKGYAMISDQPLCTGCKSADHDSFNCPFSRLPEWLGFKPNSHSDKASVTDFTDDNTKKSNPNPQNKSRGQTKEHGEAPSHRGKPNGRGLRGRGR
ncbi:hypothetical protein C0993_003119, partial [Termitomyces sp. T159_Od127]